MIRNTMSVKKVTDTIVPITRFNRGEAGKVFDEVKENGMKIVFKNNDPACVLLEPEYYEEMVEALEDFTLYFEAEQRMKAAKKKGFIPSSDVMVKLGLQESDLDDIEVDIN